MSAAMRILTVRQPWALHIIQSGKDVENRVRNVAGGYRGPVAIHSGHQADEEALRALPGLPPNGIPRVFHYGAILGVVDLADVHHATSCPTHDEAAPWPLCSPWAERDTWHLVLESPRPLANPIPYRGALGLRTLPDDVVARIHDQLGGAS